MEIFIRLEDIPHTIGAYVTYNADDTYTIVINAHWSYDMQRAAYLHELQHIRRGDLFNSAPIEQVEGIKDRLIMVPIYDYKDYCVAT